MWEQIRANKQKSIIVVICMGALLLAIGYFLGAAFLGSGIYGIILACIVWLIMNLVAFFQGDNVFLAVSKARKISRDDHPKLFNIVEEMQIASGLPKMPDIYIIDDPAPNAFATGRDPNKAAIAVTSGLLQKLNRDELQGVVAHEIGHIKNRDVLLMIIAGIMLGAIVMLAYLAWYSLILGGARDDPGTHLRQAALLRHVPQARIPRGCILSPLHQVPRGAGISAGKDILIYQRALIR